MIINRSSLDAMNTGFQTAFANGFTGAEPLWPNIAMKVVSTTAKERYTWLEQLPGMREWIGPRWIKALAMSDFLLENRDYEMTISVDRNSVEDDSYGLMTPLFTDMGRAAREHVDQLVSDVLKAGFTEPCYDGQSFFDADHPVETEEGVTVSVSNVQSGSGDPWFLLDTSRAIRPLIYQERRRFDTLVISDRDTNPNVFLNKEYLYGVDGRGAAGYGLWQLAFGSKASLNAENYAAARASMNKAVGANGRKLGIRPTTLVCGPELEEAARKLLNSENGAGGESNPWKGTAELIVSPWI